MRETVNHDLSIILDFVNGNMSVESYWQNIYFHTSGVARVGSIFGLITGHYHAGQVSFANQLASSFMSKMKQLNARENKTQFTYNGETLTVPLQKVMLGDDGCYNSLSYIIYTPIPPKEWDKRYNEFIEDIDDNDTAYSHAVAKMRTERYFGIRTESHEKEFTHTCYIHGELPPHNVKIRYAHTYIGGLIYHGDKQYNPERTNTYWGLHS